MCHHCYCYTYDIRDVYAIGIAVCMVLHGAYKCNKELETQNEDSNKYNLVKISGKTINGLVQGIPTGLFWPIIVPTMIYRSVVNNMSSIYTKIFGDNKKQIESQ